MSRSEKSFKKLAGVPVWYHLRDEPNNGDEKIFRKEKIYKCTNKLYDALNACFTELFEIWPLERPKAILSMGTLGDGDNAHGKGNAFDLSGFEFEDGRIFRMFDYDDWRHIYDGVNAHLFLYFSQVLSHFYPNHRDHFHMDFNYANRNHYRESKSQNLFIQAILKNAFEKDLGTSGRYSDGIDGVYGSRTRKALDELLYTIELSGNGGLTNVNVWHDFVIHARNTSFKRYEGGSNDDSSIREFDILTTAFYNRGAPPEDFLNELIEWARQADDEIFMRNERSDVYSKISSDLGPWRDLPHRKAGMCEVLRVLGGFESSWRWDEGRDLSTNNIEHDTMEAGIFQCSSNSLYFFQNDSYIESVFEKLGVRDRGRRRSKKFIELMKDDHNFAFEYTARLLRYTTQHHGPIKHYNGRWYQGRRHDGIGNHIKQSAVYEFLRFL